MMLFHEAADSRDPALANEPTENTDRADPTHPTERTEPTEPIDSSDPLLPIHRKESSDRMDHRDEPISALSHGDCLHTSRSEGTDSVRAYRVLAARSRRCGARRQPPPSGRIRRITGLLDEPPDLTVGSVGWTG